MKVLAFLFLLATATAQPSPHTLDAAAVDGVTIDITVGVLGPTSRYHAAYKRTSANTFTDADGKPMPESSLDALVAALENPAAPFDFARTWMTPDMLAKYLDISERAFIGPFRNTPAVEALYRSQFLDWRRLKADCEKGMQEDITVSDYYPSFKLTLTHGDTVLATVEGHSQRQFFLPVFETRDGVETKISDPVVTNAIAGMLPEKAPLRFVMLGGDVLPNWASIVAKRHEIAVLMNHGKDPTPPAFHSFFYENPCGSIGHPYATYPVDSPTASPTPIHS